MKNSNLDIYIVHQPQRVTRMDTRQTVPCQLTISSFPEAVTLEVHLHRGPFTRSDTSNRTVSIVSGLNRIVLFNRGASLDFLKSCQIHTSYIFVISFIWT